MLQQALLAAHVPVVLLIGLELQAQLPRFHGQVVTHGLLAIAGGDLLIDVRVVHPGIADVAGLADQVGAIAHRVFVFVATRN
ncbi:hypothetical protein D3C71_1811200 [compost metagenome]